MTKLMNMLAVALICVVIPQQSKAQPDLFDEKRGIPTIAAIIDGVSDAVVNIAVVSEQPIALNPLFSDPFFREFFDLPPDTYRQPQLSAGSGVIVDAENGYVLTNAHVVENGKEIIVTLTDRRDVAVEIIGTDPATDIAVLRLDVGDLSAIEMGDSDSLQVGDFVVALGNPFGLGQTVTSGIVSALGRSGINPEGYEDFIQTDASINPGNSGGALITLDGKLVGINSAIIAPTGGNVGIGFAVPINMARGVMDQLVRFGEVRRGRLGVMIQDLTPDLARALGIESDRGAIISQVVPESAAEAAGLKAGDVVLAVDGSPVNDAGDLRNLLGLSPLGEPVVLNVLRNGDRIEIRATLGSADAASEAPVVEAKEVLEGATLADLTPQMPGYEELAGGVHVVTVDPGSPADRAGLRAGDVIIGVNNTPANTISELTAQLPEPGSGPTALSVYRNGTTIYVVIR